MTDVAVEEREQRSLTTGAARNLATTTKSVPQVQASTPRWLLRMLPWVEANGAAYRVNRRLTFAAGTGKVLFAVEAGAVSVIPPSLAEISFLHGLSADPAALQALADRFTQTAYRPGEVIAAAGSPDDRLILIAHGKAAKHAEGKYGHQAVHGSAADGDHLGAVIGPPGGTWEYTVTAATPLIALTLTRQAFEEVAGQSPRLAGHVAGFLDRQRHPRNAKGEKSIEIASGHAGETLLEGTFADYELKPREYELHVAQTVLEIHTRVADLFNEPMNQIEHQLRITIEALRERQEHELLNNPGIGLLHNADLSQRLHTRHGPPTPDDMDALLARRRKTKFFLAHPLAIAAFSRECTKKRIYPETGMVEGKVVHSWRGVPVLPCDKIPVTGQHTTSILAMRTGEQDQGVIGLHQTGLPDEYEPGLSARFMRIDEQAIISYLVSAYYSAAVLVPDALGILENVEIGH